jgi:hypothetical protein
MHILAFLLAARTAAPVDTVPPYLAFPEPGLDDPAAYEGYDTRVYRDAAGNAFQVYLKGATGRVVNLWADAADESVAFSVRDSGGQPAALAWSSAGAAVTRSGGTRTVSYGLELPSRVAVGLFLLGSMRVERDLQYAGRDTLPLDVTPFPQRTCEPPSEPATSRCSALRRSTRCAPGSRRGSPRRGATPPGPSGWSR